MKESFVMNTTIVSRCQKKGIHIQHTLARKRRVKSDIIMMEWSFLNNGESRSKACLSHLIILGNMVVKLQGWKKGLVIKLSLQDRPSYFQLCHVSTSASFDTSTWSYLHYISVIEHLISLCRKYKRSFVKTTFWGCTLLHKWMECQKPVINGQSKRKVLHILQS